MDYTVIAKHLSLLGHKAKDKVTGAEGVVSSVCFDLYGCVQATLDRGLDKDGKHIDQRYYDVSRIVTIPGTRVMDPPQYLANTAQARGEQGAAEKPVFCK